MNQAFLAYIDLGRTLAAAKGLKWEIPLSNLFSAKDGIGWNLTSIAGDVPPPNHYLRDFGTEEKSLVITNKKRTESGQFPLLRQPISSSWQDFIKAAVAEQLLFKRNTAGHVAQNIIRPLRVIATCVLNEPWALQIDELIYSIEVAREIQKSGKIADLVIGVIKVIFDRHHICDVGQIYPWLGAMRKPSRNIKSKHAMSQDELRDSLEARKRAERLPERRAFWELIRISMTEKPKTFVDELRFAAIRTIIISGLRVGEIALLPFDWERERTYLDADGRPAGEAGGISKSLMLRHFAEKQQDEQSDSIVLRESTQPVPKMFRDLLLDSLNRIARITQPLRKTLKLQCETNRIFPWYDLNDLVPITEIYPQITGNPFWLDIDRSQFLERYRNDFDAQVLKDLHFAQAEAYEKSHTKLDMALYAFGNRLQKQALFGAHSLRIRSANGAVAGTEGHIRWPEAYLRVWEIEEFIKAATPSKISDMAPMPLEGGTIQSWELLFLSPKRSLAEERNDGLCDVTRYCSINRPDPTFISLFLGGSKPRMSIFERYGQTDEDRLLNIEPHSLRHLQNTELFRMGVADTIISKRFNRKSTAQSYEYDHRSLAEELDNIDLDNDLELILGDKASTVAKMISAGKANGPVVSTFRKIQRSQGDTAAYEFLRVEAGGFHATPYGHCLNSFTVDPCPKHLECFTGCRHLSATDMPENRQHLVVLAGKLNDAIEVIRSRPSASIGWQNQLDHAMKRLKGVQTLLDTQAGKIVFPDGQDFSQSETKGLFDD